jgi:tryptophan 2,3-dioxygenase
MVLHDSVLNELSAITYKTAVAALGRANIGHEMRQVACRVYDHACRLLACENSMDASARSVYELIQDLLFTEHFLSQSEKLRYVAYTNLRVLNRYLLDGQGAPKEAQWLAAKRALALIVQSWHDLEEARLCSFSMGHLDLGVIGFADAEAKDATEHLRQRAEHLRALALFTAVPGRPDIALTFREIGRHKSDWEYFAERPDHQIYHLTCMPTSRWHDEIMFLAMILATECCFAGILCSIHPLPDLASAGQWGAATETLKGAFYFSDALVELWTIFDTMPVAHFQRGFREATGNASAIQSMRFQTLEVLTRGLGEAKRHALSLQPEVGRFALWRPPDEATMPGLCSLADKCGGIAAEFVLIARQLDRDLYKWRSRHYGIARKYLPKNATGTGNEGTSYLAGNFKEPRLRPTGTFQAEKTVYRSAQRHIGAGARATHAFEAHQRGSPPVAVVEGENISAANVIILLGRQQAELEETIAARTDLVARNFEGYRSFFQPRAYPVQTQLAEYRKTRRLPVNPVPAILLSLELRSGVLMGLHDGSRTAGRVIFDTSSRDESFVGLSGERVQCGQGELIVRDEKGIIASIFQGPDKRTAIQLDAIEVHRRWLLAIIGYPNMTVGDFRTAVDDAEEWFRLAAAENVNTWIVREP